MLHELFELYTVFLRLGATTFGGGYAMLPLIQREIVEKRGWSTESDIMDYYAIGQCTPGIIAINTATFIGYRRRGIPGGIAATLGFVTPSIVIITLIAALISNYAHLAVVRNAFAGIRACVCALVLDAVIKMWKKSIVDKLSILLFLLVMAASLFFSASPILLVILAGAAGILLQSLKAKKQLRRPTGTERTTSDGRPVAEDPAPSDAAETPDISERRKDL